MDVNISIAGFLIALCSLSMSFYVLLRDSTKISIEGIYRHNPENLPDEVHFKIVNTGRRPITLHEIEFGFSHSPNYIITIYNSMNAKPKSISDKKDFSYPFLSESQVFEFFIDKNDFHLDETNIELESLTSIKIVDSMSKSKNLTGLVKSLRQNTEKFARKT